LERPLETPAPPTSSVWKRYQAFLEAEPQIVLEWHDPMTAAHGWLVINSLRGGAAGGGTRMRPGLTRDEVTFLAKTMELKFAFSGPPIGGAKSGINFDPADPDRGGVLDRWFAAIAPFLSTCYGTGGDVNVDERADIAPRCAALGLRHHQEGTVRGHMKPADDGELDRLLTQLRTDVISPVTGPPFGVDGMALSVSDLATGFATAAAALHLLSRRGIAAESQRAIVEGFGNVGGACALFLARAGVRIVGLLDAQGGLAAPDGLGSHEMEDLFRRRRHGLIPEHPGHLGPEEAKRIDEIPADLFIPAAISGNLTAERLDRLEAAGVESIVCGANQPFREGRLGSTLLQEAADRRFEVIPDVIGSMGMARTFSYLMGPSPDLDPGRVLESVGEEMRAAVDEILAIVGSSSRGLMAATLLLALDRVGA
jgi:glutamate dehydrogenase (NAD(P)+)